MPPFAQLISLFLLVLGATATVSPSRSVLRSGVAGLRTRDLLSGRQSVCNSGYYYCSGTGFYACCPNLSDLCWQNFNTNSVDCGDYSDYQNYVSEDNTSSSSDPAGSDSSSSSSSSSHKKKKGLKGGAIGGIIVGVIVILAAVAGAAFRHWKKKKNVQPSFNPASPGDNFNNVQPSNPNAPTGHGPVEYNNANEKIQPATNATEIPPSPYQPAASPAPTQYQQPYQPPVSPVQSVAQPQVYQAPQNPPVYYPPPAQQPVRQHNIPNIPQLQ